MNILLTSVGRRSYLVNYFKEALGETGQVHVSNSSSLTPAFTIADRYVVTPLIYDEEYIPFLISYCKRNQIRMLVSLFDVDLPILSKNIKMFDEIGVKVIVSDESVIDICNDKILTYKFMIENGFNTPKTYSDLEDALNAISDDEMKYPVIVKPRWGMGSIGVYQADNEAELKVFYKKTLTQIKNSYLKYESNKNLNESVIIQERLSGQEYGLDVINDLNRSHQNTIVKMKHAMRSGETDCAEIVNNVALKKLGACLSQKLGHIGNLDVDVFVVDNKPYILEMNARFGGGYPFSHIAGVNLPKALISWVNNKEISESLLKENFGVLAYKDIILTQAGLTESISCLDMDHSLVINQIKSKAEILNVLQTFDNVFKPPIAEKVRDINAYANKLFENAYVFVASKDKILGFVALYANDYSNKTAYIPYIGVMQEARNLKIGRKLLDICYKTAVAQGMKFIKLEVQKENLIACNFYKSNGFVLQGQASNKSFYMIREL